MQKRLILSVLVMLLLAAHAEALWVHHSGADPDVPFDLAYPTDPENPLELTLQIGNTSEETESILSWILKLKLLPSVGAEGSLAFLPHVAAPPDSLFGPDPGPQDSLGEDPETDVWCMDVTPEEIIGQPIFADVSRNIVKLSIVAETGTHGAFELAMEPYDPETDAGSAWFDEATFQPKAFENSIESSLFGYLLLGTIEVAEPVLVGDYNTDGKVSAADFTVWRDLFGAAMLDNRDPDNSGPVDIADFESWKDNYGNMFGNATGSTRNVPEPSCEVLLVAGWLSAQGFWILRQRVSPGSVLRID